MNYTELYNAIIAETENIDETFVENIPILVNNAERRIYQAIKIPALRANKTTYFEAGNIYLTAPTDFISAWEMAVVSSGSYSYLLPKDVSFIREAYPSPTTAGLPKYYSQYDENTFLVGPSPDANYQVQLHYFRYPESIVTATNTWLGDNFENTLLYGALVEAAVFMKSEEDIVKAYSEQYAINFKLLQQYAENKLSSGNYRG